MNLNNLRIDELVDLRTKLILENKPVDEINFLIEKNEIEYSESLNEDTAATGGPGGAVSGGDVGSSGVAMANAGIAGMGSVVSAQPSSLSGTTIGSNWSSNGGSVGSGDVSFPFPVGGKNPMFQKANTLMGMSHGSRTGKKNRIKKLDLKSMFQKKNKETSTTKRVMNFDDFQKLSITKVTKVKENLFQINQKKIDYDKRDDNFIGNCYSCNSEITNDDVYSGNFMCPNCETEGQTYELKNLKN